MHVYMKIAGSLVLLGVVVFAYGNLFYAIGDYGISAPGWAGIALALAGIALSVYARFDRALHKNDPARKRIKTMRPPGGM